MIIDSSYVQMNSTSSLKTSYKQTQNFVTQENTSQQGFQGLMDQLQLSDESLLKSQNTQSLSLVQPIEDTYELEISEEDKDKIRLLQKLIESLTGKRVRFFVPEKFKKQDVEGKQIGQQVGKGPRRIATGPMVIRETFTHYKETAKMSFQSSGSVKTQDGRTIDFDLNLHLERTFESSQYQMVQQSPLQDPLTINFDAPSANLTQEKYAFDLTPGGEMEEISFVKGGSGFLAIDKNHDGIINNGSELFGPGSGNGFLELAQFDDDGNGWIDEKDAIFDDLLIWTKDPSGKDQLFGLLKKDVGAIYLGNVNTQFGLKDTGNHLLGQIASTGLFLKESGGVGTIQHIDLSV